MRKEIESIACRNCGKNAQGDFCSNCGLRQEIRRIDSRYLINEFGQIFNFDRGILFTIKTLLIRPGTSVRNFINGDRVRMMKPLLFLIISSLIYTVIQRIFGFEDMYMTANGSDHELEVRIMQWIQANYGYANLVMAIFISLWAKLFFRKHQFNLFEVIILMCYLMGIGMLAFALFGMLQSITGINLLQIIGSLAILYVSWGIATFFNGKKWYNYLLGFFSYILGFLSFVFIVLMIARLITHLI